MKNGKYENKAVPARKSASVRSLALLLALVLLLGGVIGGTIAWLADKSDDVVNTFSTSDISIELKEHEYNPATDALTDKETTTGVSNYKMIPGWTIPKDPWAMVTTNSEDCYLFVKVEQTDNFGKYLEYEINTSDWTKLDGVDENVYYIEIDTSAEKGKSFYILKDNLVTVRDEVTKEDMSKITTDADKPALSFTAYAVQLWKTNKPAEGADETQIADAKFGAAAAWAEAEGLE